jgi:hypothetical protein
MFCETSVAIARMVSDWLPPSALPNSNDGAAIAIPSKDTIKAIASIGSLIHTDIRARTVAISGISAVSGGCFTLLTGGEGGMGVPDNAAARKLNGPWSNTAAWRVKGSRL